jgi:hypothetical protein
MNSEDVLLLKLVSITSSPGNSGRIIGSVDFSITGTSIKSDSMREKMNLLFYLRI